MSVPGIYPGLPESVYRGPEWGPLPSWSTVGRCVTASPLHARHAADNPPTPTAAMRLGTAIHSAVLEPDDFRERYTTEQINRRTKEGKARAAELAETGIEVLSPDEAQTIAGARSAALHALEAHSPAWFDGARVELSLCSDVFQTLGRGRLDLVLSDGSIVDLKTTRDLSPRAIERAAWDRGYSGQLASYRAMLEDLGDYPVERVGILWVSSTAPHHAAITWLSHDYLTRGAELARRAWRLWRECSKSGVWPGPEIAPTLDAPRWAQ